MDTKSGAGHRDRLSCGVCLEVAGIDSGAFVDDFLHCIIVLAHLLCAGSAGGCPICQSALDAAQARFDALDQTFTDCALIFSTKGDMLVSQRHTFLGIIFDTHRGRLYITAEKSDKLMMLLRERMDLVPCMPRSMAKLRGKAQLHFRCLEGVRPFLSRFYRFIGGPESVYEWDLETEVSGELRHVMGFLFSRLPTLREANAEMRPLEPSTVYFQWSEGIPTQYGDLVVATCDAFGSRYCTDHSHQARPSKSHGVHAL